MIVYMQCKDRSVSGVHTGPAKVRRRFRGNGRAIEINLKGRFIGRKLKPGIWRDEAKVIDLRLCARPEARRAQRESRSASSRLVMFPSPKTPSRIQVISGYENEPAPPESGG